MAHDSKVEENSTVTITQIEYDSLLEDSFWLGCLEAAGVDNWEGIDTAREIAEELEV